MSLYKPAKDKFEYFIHMGYRVIRGKRRQWLIGGRRLGWVLMVAVTTFALLMFPARENTASVGQSARLLLVGIGPGAPDLITIRAVNAIRSAHVVFCSQKETEAFDDYLKGKEVIIPPMLRYWEGLEKNCASPTESQKPECSRIVSEIKKRTALIRGFLKEGKTVAILESGDPCIFGSLRWIKREFGDEEFEVVPGLSSFNVANALLEREVADAYAAKNQTRSIILTTALRTGKRKDAVGDLSSHRSGMVFFMPREFERKALPELRKNYPPDTPVASVCRAGNSGEEYVLKGTVADFPNQSEEQRWECLIYVGDFLNDPKAAP